jgi:hypothetical protein
MVESGFTPHRSHLVTLVSIEDWVAKAHSDAPALPWISDDGAEICSFAIVPLENAGSVMAVLLDAHGNEVIQSSAAGPILVTCIALNPTLWELTFLPVATHLSLIARPPQQIPSR